MDSVVVGGVDATQDALAAMKAGDLDVTVFQNAAGQGKGAVDAALKLAKGEKVEKKVYIPFELVTPANLKDSTSRRTEACPWARGCAALGPQLKQACPKCSLCTGRR
jgi:ABC-type sugar transport system substrate-binding protein